MRDAVVAATDGAGLDDPAPDVVLLDAALDAAALETGPLEAALEVPAEEARLLALAGPLDSVPRAAAGW